MHHITLEAQSGPQYRTSALLRTHANLTCLRVLIVDNDTKHRQLLAHILEGKTFTVVGEASTSETAIAMLEDTNPHLILIGSSLPDSESLELVEHIEINALEIGVTVLRDMQNFNSVAQLIEHGAGAVLAASVDSATLLKELFRAGSRCIARLATKCIVSFKAPVSERVLRSLPSQA